MHLLIRVAKHKSCQTSSLQKNFNIWYFFAKQRREKIWVIRVSWRFLMPRLQLMLSAEKKPESKTMGQFFSFSLSLTHTHAHTHKRTHKHLLSLSLSFSFGKNSKRGISKTGNTVVSWDHSSTFIFLNAEKLWFKHFEFYYVKLQSNHCLWVSLRLNTSSASCTLITEST